MTAPYCGGHAITKILEEGPQTIRVLFTSTYGTDYLHQLYVNRSFVGVTDTTSDREIIATAVIADWPQEVQILAVDPGERFTDYGTDLPPRPYNQVKLSITTSGWTDAEMIEVTAGAAAGDAVDSENVIGRVLFDSNGAFTFISEPREGSGEHNFEIAGVDGTEPFGNRGTAEQVSVSIWAHPPDVEYQDDGTRFLVSATGGTLTIGFTEAI